MNPPASRLRLWPGLTALLGLLISSLAWATADGPDHYRVRGLTPPDTLPLHAKPKGRAATLGRIPADACLRNLGCSGGLSLEEFNSLDEAQKQRRQADNPRWCKVEHQGQTGWVEARYLAEAACGSSMTDSKPGAVPSGETPITAPGQRIEKLDFTDGKTKVTIKQRLMGREYTDYQVRAAAGQTLTVTLKAGNPQNYFNINPPGAESAMFIGSSSGSRFSRRLPTDGEYTIRVYLMRAAARRNESSRFILEAGLTGQPLPPIPARQDALIPGTPFHASANIACPVEVGQAPASCEAFVIRRRFDGTATVEVRWREGTLQNTTRILFVKGRPVSSDATGSLSHARQGDVTRVRLGRGASFDIPDALVSGC